MTTLTGSIIVTTQGRAELLAGTFEPTEIAVGTASWTPTAASTALSAEASRFDVEGAVTQVGEDARTNIQGIDEAALAYDCKEFALFDAGGDCLVIYSQATTIITKALSSALVLSLQLVITDADAVDVTLGDTTFQLPAATDSLAGIVELATDAETQTGTDTARAVTPAGLAATTATETRAGVIELATDAETETGTDTDRAVTPAGLASMIESGSWAPTLTHGGGVANGVVVSGFYTRIGDVVSFSARGTIDFSTMDTGSNFQLSLPVTSDFTLSSQACGVVSASNTDLLTVNGYVSPQTGNDRLYVTLRVDQDDGGSGSVTGASWAISGHYEVI